MREYEPDVVGLSVMTFQRATAFKIARLVKHLRPQTRVVVGGYDPSLAPAAYEPCDDVDFLVRGEGEQTFCELLRALGGRRISSVDRGAVLQKQDRSCTTRPAMQRVGSWPRAGDRDPEIESASPAQPRRARPQGLYDARTPGRCRRNVEGLHVRLQLLLDHRDARPQLPRLLDRARDCRHRRCAKPRREGHLSRRRQHHARHPPLRSCCARPLSKPDSTTSSISCRP